MATKFYQRKVTINSKKFNLKFFLGDPGDFCVEPAGASALEWANNGAFGTNASFFGESGGKASMSALHIFRNKNMQQYPGNALDGNYNTEDYGNRSTAMDFMYYTGSTVGVKIRNPYWSPSENSGITNMEWGIGGYNMFVSNSFASQNAFNTSLKNYYTNSKYMAGNKNDMQTSRTAIGYRSADKKIALVAIFDESNKYSLGPSMYEVHLVMKYLGCSDALCLDGSNCTKVSYKASDGKTIQVVDNGSRPTFCRIRLLVSAAENCDWTGV